MSGADNSAVGPFVWATAWRIVVAALVTAALWFPLSNADPTRLSDMADSLSAAGGVFGGFLLTAATLLATVLDRALVKKLRTTGHLDYLLIETFAGVVIFLALALVGALTRVMADPQAMLWLSVADVFLAVLGAYMLLSVGRKFFLLITMI